MPTKGELTRENVLDIAQTLMLEKGFSGTSIDEIIEESGLTKGGFFYHFESKNDLAKQLMYKYQRDDADFFDTLLQRADELSEDPLQQMLIFLKLLAEAMGDLPGLHPGCLVANFTFYSQMLNDDVKNAAAETVVVWRNMFLDRINRINEKYTQKIETDNVQLADMLNSVIEGGIIVSRAQNDKNILPQHILLYRDYLRFIYGDV
ncbi:TetR/AcrR family transcriptional regulator [Kaarinaea lacus]